MSDMGSTAYGRKWRRIESAPENTGIWTMTDDSSCRNEVKLVRRGGLWCGPSGMYFGYAPTHWSPVNG